MRRRKRNAEYRARRATRDWKRWKRKARARGDEMRADQIRAVMLEGLHTVLPEKYARAAMGYFSMIEEA